MRAKDKTQSGFTIVELLIVIVVIGILAAITIVAYNGIQERARSTTVTSALSQAAKKFAVYQVDYPNAYPAALSDIGIQNTPKITYQYVVNNTDQPATYCLTATTGSTTYYITGNTPSQAGNCSDNNGSVGWWALNGNANDQSGGNNGTVSGATATTGQNGQGNGAYSFNGTTTYISGAAPSLGITNITMSGWGLIQPGVTKGTIAHVGGNNGYSIGVGNNLTSLDNTVTVLFPQRRWVLTGATITAGWHLFTLTLAADSTPSIYLDGTKIGTYAGTAPSTPTAQISIGRNIGDEGANQAERSFNSSIDDVRIYNRALSTAEVSTLYTQGAQ
jgi:prepilin-type N-terminal cleavage/methylation domain-containing protein